MASLVAEVLKKSGRFAKDDVHTALEKLSRKIEEVKVRWRCTKRSMTIYVLAGEGRSEWHRSEAVQGICSRIR
jgi:ElaB/YqjD/DUF883 family membrane-anchored ribosome-binding protein